LLRINQFSVFQARAKTILNAKAQRRKGRKAINYTLREKEPATDFTDNTDYRFYLWNLWQQFFFLKSTPLLAALHLCAFALKTC
jgi:hypothetical protein